MFLYTTFNVFPTVKPCKIEYFRNVFPYVLLIYKSIKFGHAFLRSDIWSPKSFIDYYNHIC